MAGRVHFVGIGGAGMSAIAKVLMERGREVSGSDLKRSRALAVLEAMGAKVHLGHDAGHVDGAELVVVSSAIPEHNAEVVAAVEAAIPIETRGQALASVLKDRRAIIVAGTHGKTTTTSMLVAVLRAAGIDPTYLIGGGLNESGTNARFGQDDLAVAESDESDGSFLLLRPSIGVVTNVEIDHVDFYESVESLRAAFADFVRNIPSDGIAVLPGHETSLQAAAAETGARLLTFGDGAEVSAEDVDLKFEGASFTLATPQAHVPVTLRVPGFHNVANALAAAAAGLAAGVTPEAAAHGLSDYRGVERRMQVRGRVAGITIIDDYAHHPTEVRATLAAARPGPWTRVVAVFQPHRYSRTAVLGPAFGEAFGDADRIVVTEVYGAGEQPVPGISGKLIADAVCRALPGRPVAYLPHRDELLAYLQRAAKAGDVVLTLGAGDVTAVGEELLARLGDGS